MIKYLFIIIFSILSFTGSSLSEKADENLKVEMYEVCADDLFVRQFGDKFRYYLSMHVKTKIYKNKVYQWLYEDCEKQSKSKPITFNLKNRLYKEDLNEITSEVFEKCADERYVLEFGDTYSQFLDLNLKEKMKQQIEYEWYVEACEDEYRSYPIKFRIKYY